MRVWLIAVGVFLSAWAAPAGILIVQHTTGSRSDDADSERILTQLIAEEFDTDGRLTAIAWSLSDPIFRSAVNDKLVRASDNPDQSTALAGAEKLRAEYVLMVSVFRREGQVVGQAQLFRRGRQIWKDPDGTVGGAARSDRAELGDARVFTVLTNSQIDLANTLRAASRTWCQLLFDNPLKSLNPRPRTETPDPDPGVKPDIPEAPPVKKVENGQLMTDVMKLLAGGKMPEAIAMLRDAVDAEPLDLERRKALTNALATSGLTETAAKEARRAALLFPDQVDLWALAARFWLAVDEFDEANKDLNEAVARQPESVETRLLLAEVALGKLQVDVAIPHLDFAIQQAPSADGYFKRALARALNDDATGAAADLAEAKKLGFGGDALVLKTQYSSAVRVAHAAMQEAVVAIRTLLPKARANFGSREVREDQKVVAKRLESLGAILEVVPVPAAHKNSHGKRTLALSLLAQSSGELGSFLDSGVEDSANDAVISLSEALKALQEADAAFRSERS
ncbi:MAG: hypothetical protein IT363_14130 [Methanoregulaceae archaeon]|nr:hypothetical protein [Methanoregulaceae archaeon]